MAKFGNVLSPETVGKLLETRGILEERKLFCVITPDSNLPRERAVTDVVNTALELDRLKLVPEITLRGGDPSIACEAISRIAKQNIFVGAGTVITPQHAELARDAGAKFMVGPGFTSHTPKIIACCHGSKILPIVGIGDMREGEQLAEIVQGTPSIMVKYFPVESLTEANWRNSIEGPLPASDVERFRSEISLNSEAATVGTFGRIYDALSRSPGGSLEFRVPNPEDNLMAMEELQRRFNFCFVTTGGVRSDNAARLLAHTAVVGIGIALKPNPAEIDKAVEPFLSSLQ